MILPRMIAMWGSVVAGAMTVDTAALVVASEKLKCTGRGVCTRANSGSISLCRCFLAVRAQRLDPTT